MENNRQYSEMLSAALSKFAGMKPEDIADRCGIKFHSEKSVFEFASFGKNITVKYPSFEINTPVEMWQHLTILQYMDEADGYPLGKKLISISEFKEGGLVRGTSFERESENLIQRGIGSKDPDAVKAAGVRLGGKIIESTADLTMEFSFMPNFPVTVNLWFADDEFPASGKVLFNESAEHYLKVEAAGTVASLLLNKWNGECDK